MAQQDVLDGSVGIPLHCNVCPKKPDFSDVSHLLTHIASKGHLSNYYKLKIQAVSDRAAARLTDEYDQWYEDYNVQELMGERMKQKEKRKSSGGGGSNPSRRTSTVNAAARGTPVSTTYVERRRTFRESTLDPQLGHPRIKIEPDSRAATPLSAYSLDPAALSRSYMPPMLPPAWSTTPFGNSPTPQEETSIFDSPDSSLSSEWAESEPKRGRGRTARELTDVGSCFGYDEDDEFEDVGYDDGKWNGTKLKGVVWDGMDMFDSATPDMRRKRNQKKEYSVIKSLMATSEVVEPTEMIFDADGELNRERKITGVPNEDDGMTPLKGEESPEVESPPPKKKTGTRRPRPALTQKNVNNGRVLRDRRRDSHHPGFSKGSGRGPYFDGPGEEDELTYGSRRPKKRSGLSIHRDNSGPEITFDHPASLNMLNSSFRPRQAGSACDQFMHHGGCTFGDNYTHQRLPSLNTGSGFRAADTPQLGSFGQLSGQSFFQNTHFNPNPLAMMPGLAAFQQSVGGLGMPQPMANPFGLENMFPAHAHSLVQPQAA